MICREKEKYFPVSFWYKERFLQSKRCRAEIERPVKAHVSYGVKITTEGKFFCTLSIKNHDSCDSSRLYAGNETPRVHLALCGKCRKRESRRTLSFFFFFAVFCSFLHYAVQYRQVKGSPYSRLKSRECGS